MTDVVEIIVDQPPQIIEVVKDPEPQIVEVVAAGPSGPQGIQGIQGIQGEQGIQGIQGIQGNPGEGVPVGGAAGEVLKKASNDDYATEWGSVDGLPSQTGNTGKFLTTDGTDASWADVTAGVASVNGQTGVVVLTASDVGAANQAAVNLLLMGL